MDTLGALALATEPPTDHQMQRSPVVRSVMLLIILHVLMQSCMYSREPLITNVTWGDRLMQAIYHLSVLLVLNFNVVALVISFVALVSSGDLPRNKKLLFWVTLIMDTLGALTMATEPALATERPTDHQTHRPPVGRSVMLLLILHVLMQSCMYSRDNHVLVQREPLITNIMWRNLLIQAIYQSSVLLALNFYGKSLLNLEHDTSDHVNKVKNTLIFNSFVICQIFNEFNARKPDEKNIFAGITKNRLFMGTVALTVVLHILIIEFLGTVRLNWKHWIISVVIGFIGWPLAFLGKFIPVPATPLSSIFKSNTQSKNPTMPSSSSYYSVHWDLILQ
ncbi:hypothetical protein QYF36_025983 [Acer negundo]|nr:hypothetical protein QYF36_025983 [Acer negundo]